MSTELKDATAAPSPWEQATLFINGKKVEWRAELVLLREQEYEVTVEAPPEIARALNLGLADNGALETVASPEFGAWVAPANGKFTWKITPDAGKSGRITLVFFSREVLVPWEHRSLVISSNLADEADVKINGVDVPAGGNWFFWDKPQTVTLTPKPGSPLAGLPVTLTCAIKSGLRPLVVSQPQFGSEQTRYSWAVGGYSGSGTFQLTLSGKGMTTPITLAVSKLLSNNLADEVDVMIDGKEASDAEVVYLRNAKHKITLAPKLNSPLAGYPLSLQWIRGDGVVPVDLTFQPQLDTETDVHSWDVTGSATEAGTFELGIVGAGFNAPMILPVSRQISAKYFLDGKEFSGFKDVVNGRMYRFHVEVLGGISRVHVENSPGELGFNPPLNRWFDLSSGGVTWGFTPNVNDFVTETVRFNYSSVYFARDTISFAIAPT